jgi:hypothetical protein
MPIESFYQLIFYQRTVPCGKNVDNKTAGAAARRCFY